MSITDRDKKILMVLAVLGALAAYWFLLLAPKRDEVAKLDEEVASQQQQLDAARAQVQAARGAQASFETDYAEMVRLGKAIPSSLDMPSLLVQLDRAADGTHIDVDKITVGPRLAAGSTAAAAPAPPPPAEGDAAPGGEEASSAPGQAAEGAAESGEELDTQTSETAREGSVPVGGGSQGAAGAAAPASGAPPVAGLDSVGIDFEFAGSFFDLADFFHRLKRFVHVGENGIVVRGRLMTIDTFSFSAGEDGEGASAADELTATVKATVYLAPKSEGATAGATPAGPAAQGDTTTAGAPTPPTATVQP